MKKELIMKVSDTLEVTVQVDDEHQFLMSTADVAKGYGVATATLRSHKADHLDELTEGKHFIRCVGKSNARCKSTGYINRSQILWTKRGIVRLGFFIKSERAKIFRDWAEDLIIAINDINENAHPVVKLPESTKRAHNRLSRDRIISILIDVSKIEDAKLRESIVNKLTNY